MPSGDSLRAYAWIEDALQVIHRANWYRSPYAIDSGAGSTLMIEGQPCLNFASNDYLGLSTDDALKQAAIAAIQDLGTGATGSRLLSGQRSLHQQLEEAIAQWKGTEAALVFSSGYLANLSTIAALVGPRDIIFADAYNHSSLKKGAKLSGAAVVEFKHGHPPDLVQKITQYRQDYRRALILSDGVFSMDGDLCPLPELMAIASAHSAMLLIDDAHATGVVGPSGAGTAEAFGLSDQPLIQVGTLSKALASLGGYVAGSLSLIDFLRNRAAGWIYTTALSPADAASALAALNRCRRDPPQRQKLWRNIEILRQGFAALGWQTPDSQPFASQRTRLLPSDSAIHCLELPTPQAALDLSQWLRTQGCFVPAIRPPTVPTSRIRISLMATHSEAQIQQLLSALAIYGTPEAKTEEII
ncbi:8-amino-7-oxononanoate synthase [Lyngbya confervoides]|uniref:8-amino-7-ketopelargonate synthase n=1 Tax=Lyngbya confervoides BDU141951 TaxID=1574623 RepID=A0ABD4T158_9CYAN|nr:8-amino-7-oxononanoate synthase [Lyngbya confervoides]MCM1982168.1 8-amino-7-oxononanoate synthase [Lyngbya confervoides BDU141951]